VAAFVADEEHASLGTQALCRTLCRWHPAAALVLEPTALDVCLAHQGFVWAEVVTRGRAVHGSRADLGVDAIAHMGRVLAGVEALARDLQARPPHPLVGAPSLHAALISGGQELSSYPASCRLALERRTVPGETAAQVEAELRAILDRLAAADPRFAATLALGLVRDPFAAAAETPIVAALAAAAAAEVGRPPRWVGQGGWMDSALLAAAGVPTAVFGPGGEGAHALTEWADLETLVPFARVLARTAYAFCTG